MNLAVDSASLTSELKALAEFSEREPTNRPGETAVTRVVFGQADLRARAYVESIALAAGLTVRHDPAGNTFFRWQGAEPALPAIATGSHIDAIPNAGMYDGTVGVLGGIAAVRALKAARFVPRRSIDVILFTSEEPTRFGIGCLGSRLLSGTLSLWDAVKLRDSEGRTLDQLRLAAGFPGQLEDVQLRPGTYAHFVELHIEQGPLLEAEAQPIGVVTAIAAPASLRLNVHGEGGHAGAMLMPVRHDALVAAAEIIQAVEHAALDTHALDTVATIGICDVFPGAVNSVPSHVRLTLDVRDIDLARRDRVLAQILAACNEIAQRRGVKVTSETLNADAPCTCDPTVVAAIETACASEGFQARPIVSRAYHDTLFMSRLCPVGMIFIPCKGGVSHRPDEFSTTGQIVTGVTVLARTLAELSLRD